MNIAKIKILKKIGIIIFPIIVLIIICLFISVVIYTTKTVKITDANEYLKTVEYISEFIVFPETIKDIKNVKEYHYYDYQLLGGAEIILIAEYDKEKFYEEINRLKNLEYFPDNIIPRYTFLAEDYERKFFNTPALVATYVPNEVYEYACFDETTFTIAYIYIGYMAKEKITISDEWLPKILTDDNDIYDDYLFDIYIPRFDDRWFFE